jgi:hypothetical protein
VTVPDSPSLVEVVGGLVQGLAAFGLGLLLVLLILAVKAAPLIALFAAAFRFHRCPRRRAVAAWGYAVAALLLAHLWLPAPPNVAHPTWGSVLLFLGAALLVITATNTSLDLSRPPLPAPGDAKTITVPDIGDGEAPDGHARIVATLPPAIAADFYDHLICCDENRARCGHDVTDSKWADPDDPGWGPTCPDCAAVEDDDCPACTTGATTPANWVTRDETGATS